MGTINDRRVEIDGRVWTVSIAETGVTTPSGERGPTGLLLRFTAVGLPRRGLHVGWRPSEFAAKTDIELRTLLRKSFEM
jgi:hypothetical protein